MSGGALGYGYAKVQELAENKVTHVSTIKEKLSAISDDLSGIWPLDDALRAILFAVVQQCFDVDDERTKQLVSDFGVLILAFVVQWPIEAPEKRQEVFEAMRDMTFMEIVNILRWEAEHKALVSQMIEQEKECNHE